MKLTLINLIGILYVLNNCKNLKKLIKININSKNYIILLLDSLKLGVLNPSHLN